MFSYIYILKSYVSNVEDNGFHNSFTLMNFKELYAPLSFLWVVECEGSTYLCISDNNRNLDFFVLVDKA